MLHVLQQRSNVCGFTRAMSGFASIEQLRDPNDFKRMQTEAQERVHELTQWLDSQQVFC